MNAYSKIGTVRLAPTAPAAPARIEPGRSALLIEPDTLPRTESGADAAALAPVPKDIDLEALALWWFVTFARCPLFSPRWAVASLFSAQGAFTLLWIAFHYTLETFDVLLNGFSLINKDNINAANDKIAKKLKAFV